MSDNKIKHYSNGEVTIVWEAAKCIHSGNCVRGLPTVFNSKEQPWIKPQGASSDAIVQQVSQCPSGALSYFSNNASESASVEHEIIAEVSKNGPLLVYGNLTVKDAEGNETKKHKVTAFCRCGSSSNKPYCDGTHRKIEFQG